MCDLNHIDRTSLHDFVEQSQESYQIGKEIYVCANEHARLLKEQLSVECMSQRK